MPAKLPWFCWPHVIGLDAAFLAVAWQAIAAMSLGIALPFAASAVLFLAVAGIYACDRVWDATREPQAGHWRQAVPRRRLYAFLIGGLLALTAAGVLAWFSLPPGVLCAGIGVGILCAAYYGSKRWTERHWSREFCAVVLGCIFSLGLWLPVVSLSLTHPGAKAMGLFVAMACLFSANAFVCASARKARPTMAIFAAISSIAFGVVTGDWPTASLLFVASLFMLCIGRCAILPIPRSAFADAALLLAGIAGWWALPICGKIGEGLWLTP